MSIVRQQDFDDPRKKTVQASLICPLLETDARQRNVRVVVHATALPAFAVQKGRLFVICAWGSMQQNAPLQQAYIAGSALTDPRYEVERWLLQ